MWWLQAFKNKARTVLFKCSMPRENKQELLKIFKQYKISIQWDFWKAFGFSLLLNPSYIQTFPLEIPSEEGRGSR